MTPTYETLPPFLKSFCVEQDYDRYTPQDQAAWRYIMRQNLNFFREHALPIYEEGLSKTGIPIERIPMISEMDEKLKQYGWGAVAVSGFIPGAAFLEFQARGVLAIACDMRTTEHIEYTPAPDIVHEAAGHAPIIADPAYAHYLRQYAKLAQKAIISDEDVTLYEAIRYLSDIKERAETTPAQVKEAEERFHNAAASISFVSEASKVGRMAWWTVEYGLVGNLKNPKIYGAGLLSSVGESQNCFKDHVKKIPFSVECVEQAFDITKPQPQLFVAPHMEELILALEELESDMSYTLGGIVGLERAKQAKSVNTVILNSGVEIAGILENYEADAENVEFVKFTGPVQLAHKSKELLGQGRAHHPEGFSSPIGRWKKNPELDPSKLTDEQLASAGIKRGHNCTLEFQNGFVVEGMVASWIRRGENIQYITWNNCTVKRGGQIYFEPSWGVFDMVVGVRVVSVHGGPASRDEYGDYRVGEAASSPARTSPFTEQELDIFAGYKLVREIRENSSRDQMESTARLEKLAKNLTSQHTREWLLALEVVELAKNDLNLDPKENAWLKRLSEKMFDNRQDFDESTQKLIVNGLSLLQ